MTTHISKSRHLLFRKYQTLLLWIGTYLLLFMGGSRYDMGASVVNSFISLIGMLWLVFLNKYILIPCLLTPHRQLLYYMLSFIILSFSIGMFSKLDLWTISYFWNVPLENLPNLIYPIFKNSILQISAFTITTITHSMSKAKEAGIHAENLQNEKLDMELRFLKSQINPHFLFNALNNIYSLVYTNDKNAPDSILKLSEMLRYITDECQAEKISIDKEIKYIESFIDFQLMRIDGPRNISLTKSICNPAFCLPPMILQPFIENSFKHSRIESTPSGYIHIYLTQNKSSLSLVVENSQPHSPLNKPDTRSGIGIENVKKRLDLAFGNKYALVIENKPEYYRVKLNIEI